MRQIANQGTLLQVLHSIFPDFNIVNNARQILKNPQTGQVLELDCWISDKNVAVEFQDQYHFECTWYKHETIASVKHKDELKKIAVIKRGDTLITIPYWWNCEKRSVIAEIKFHRPDLCIDDPDACEIPLNPLYTQNNYIYSHVSELMNPSFPPIGHILNVTACAPWWLGEKYDGIRVCWNVDMQVLYTRTGNSIESFHKVSRSFPAFSLDGELWCGRNNFSQCHRLLMHSVFDFMKIVAFDVPVCGPVFEERYENLLQLKSDHEFLILAPRMVTNSMDQVESMTRGILEQGGEGVIVQKILSLYLSGRTDSVVKLKAHQRDGEALVVETNEKWFTIKLLHGVLISLETSNLAEGLKISKGDIVTFSYDAIDFHNLPSHIKILRVRNDITWKDLKPTEDTSAMLSSAESRQSLLNFESARAFGQLKTITTNNKFSPEELRIFFNNLAKVCNINSKNMSEWYSLNSQKLRSVKGGRTIELHCGGMVPALQRAYPEFIFDPSKFSVKRKHYWEESKNVKRLFDDFATHMEFDSNIPANWYKYISTASLSDFGIQARGSYIKMLMFAYPNIGLDPAHFYRNQKREIYMQKNLTEMAPKTMIEDELKEVAPKKYHHNWKNITVQKDFFDCFAKARQFDPLQAENWNVIHIRDIDSTAKGQYVMKFYPGNNLNRLQVALKKIYNF